MKKTYTKITVLICVLVAAVMVLGIALFSHIQISAENERCFNSISFSINDRVDKSNFMDDGFDSLMTSYMGFKFFERTEYADVGYYGKCTWTWNDLHLTQTVDSTSYRHGSMILNDSDNNIVEIGFSPDEETNHFKVLIYKTSTDVATEDGTTVISEGFTVELNEPDVHVDYLPEENNEIYGLDAEAKAKYDYLISTPGALFGNPGHLGWFTSYLVYDTTEDVADGAITVRNEDVFVFHPFKMVLEKYLYVYILFFIVLVVLQALTIIMMRRMYLTRMSYEARTKNLTRSFAHELKTPLAVTKSYVENWEIVPEDERPEVASKITSEVDHMTKMVNTLLDLSKMDTGEVTLKLEDVDLFGLSQVCYKHLEELAKAKNIKVDFITKPEEGDFTVSADLDMMKMVISNFMSNAIKYGKEKVEVSLVDGSNNVTFKIANDGEPISKKDQKKIWELFYKKDKSGSDRLSSTGVGLAVNKSILDIHKAKFGVESGASGTTFWFEMKKA